MESCLYEGRVRHIRRTPAPHRFEIRLFMVYLDLAELEAAFHGRWFWSTRRAALARFRRADHLGDPAQPLDTSVRDLVEARTGNRPDGPIRVLTHLRYYGYVFNPVSFFYCFASGDRDVTAIVVDITNTPWGERHQYVFEARDSGAAEPASRRFLLRKEFHVSPYMPMDVEYDWRFTRPADRLSVAMLSRRGGADFFSAELELERRPISTGALAAALLRFPPMTLRVIGAIYWQALRLWLKGAPFHSHPRATTNTEVTR